VIDNFSLYVLAWSVFRSYGGKNTKELLYKAVQKAQAFGFYNIPEVMVDSGQG